MGLVSSSAQLHNQTRPPLKLVWFPQTTYFTSYRGRTILVLVPSPFPSIQKNASRPFAAPNTVVNMKSTSRRFGPLILITTILLLAFLSCETSLHVDAKRVFRPERQDAAELELAQSVAVHKPSKTTPGAFIAGNTKELGKRDGLVEKRDEEVGFHLLKTRHVSTAIKRGIESQNLAMTVPASPSRQKQMQVHTGKLCGRVSRAFQLPRLVLL